MTSISSFAADAVAWQNFYLLVGTSAATLVGLMFVAITFGSSLVTQQTSTSVRSFLDPTFAHFVHVLLTACLFMIPTMGPTLFGGLLVAISAVRTASLFRVYRHMLEAHRIHNDIELSDWLSGIVVPLFCFLVMSGAGAAFILRYAVAFNALAVAVVVILLNGIFGAWELMLWLALTRARVKEDRLESPQEPG